jgi:glycosyltransferase involved in cell wall biosynthesis
MTARPCHICLLIPDLPGGGAERVAVNLAQAMVDRGYRVEMAMMSATGELLAELNPSVTVFDLHAPRARNVLFPLVRYLRATKPQSVLVLMWPLTVMTLFATLLLRHPPRVIVSDHNVVSRSSAARRQWQQWLLKTSMRWLYPRAAAVVAVSEGVANDMAAHTGLPIGSITTIHNPASRGWLPAPMPNDDLPAGWRTPGYRRLITVGMLKLEKDQRTLIAAFAKLRQKLPVKLLILGEGPLRSELAGQIHALGVADDVDLHGFAPDPYPYYLAADLFVLSSNAEGFGNVLVEAMECGLPVVSTDCVAGPAEVLDGGRYGWLVPVGDADSLAEAMYAALLAPVDAQRQRTRAAEFGIARAVDSYLQLLDPKPIDQSKPDRCD